MRRKVGIVGAGMAGLVAGRLLHDSGFDVALFEARERIGGRVWTDREKLGTAIDFGGSWIHGADDNPLTDWCDALQVRVLPSASERAFFVDGRGAAIPQRRLLGRAWLGRTAARLAIAAALSRQRLRMALGRSRPLSLADVMEPLLASRLLPHFDRQVLALTVSTSEGVQGAPAERLAIEEWFPADAFKVNAMPEGGFARLIADAAAGLEIHLSQPVHRIDWNDTEIVLHDVEIAHRVDYAIVTAPLGLLQAGIPLFSPALPQDRRDAVHRLGFGGGVLGKLYVRFPHRFWPAGVDRLGSLPPTPLGRGRFATWFSLERETAAPILLGFANGNAALEFERNHSDEAVLAVGLEVLRGMFGSAVPQPTAFHFTRWLADPWARGSYSYTAVGSRAEDRVSYAQPLAGRLFFAGEASEPQDYGTVHAALRSGERAAEAVFAATHGSAPDRGRRPWRASRRNLSS